MRTPAAMARLVVANSIWVGGLVGSLLSTNAHAQSRAAVDVTVGARAATNPYDASGKNSAAVAISLGVNPSLTIVHELSTLALSGSAKVDQYLSRYGTDVSARANADYERRLSEAATVGATATFSTTRSGISDLLRNGDALGTIAGAPIPISEQLIDVAGIPSRQNRYSFAIRANVRPSDFDTFQASTGIALSRVSSGQGRNYRQLYTNLGYSRTLSQSTSLTAQLAFADVDYAGCRDGDGQIISPLVGVNVRLDPTLTLAISGGVSIARIEQTGRKRTQAGLAAQGSLCKRGELTNICLTGSRDTQPSSLGGISRATSIGFNIDRRLSPSSTIGATARYGRTDQPTASRDEFGFRRTEFVSASATYSRRLSERVFLTISPGFDKVTDGVRARRANYEIMAGIRIRFGQFG